VADEAPEITEEISPNERTARTFAEQFTPPLNVCATERINNMPVPDAWAISYHDGARGLGITAVAFHGGLHAYLEAAGKGDIAEHAGQVLAKALGLFNACGNGECCAMETGDAIENASGQRVCSYCKKPVALNSDR